MYSALEWEKPGKLYVVLQRFKSDRKQIRRGAACAVCRKNKRRCDGERPCKSCISSKCEAKCLGADKEGGPAETEGALEVKVERPIPFEGGLVFRDNDSVQIARSSFLPTHPLRCPVLTHIVFCQVTEAQVWLP